MSHLFCPDARSAPDGPRHWARRPLGLAELRSDARAEEKRRVQKKEALPRQLLISCTKHVHTFPYGRFGTLASESEQERFAKATKGTSVHACGMNICP